MASTSTAGYATPPLPATPTLARSAATTPTTESERQLGAQDSTTSTNTRARGPLGTAGRPLHHRQGLSAIRAFLRRESCFDILPESFRLIVFDNKLLIKRALVALQTNGEVQLASWMRARIDLQDAFHHIRYLRSLIGRVFQVSYQPPFTTRPIIASSECSPWSTSSISFNIIILARRAMTMPLLRWKA